MDSNQTRRKFIKNVAASSLYMSPLIFDHASLLGTNTISVLPDLYIFSKHLQFLNFRDMSEAAVEMGFSGVDLTVRPKGHVLPERVTQDLPQATETMRSFGLKTDLITTKVNNIDDPIQRKVIETAQKSGYVYYRTDWFRYNDKAVKEVQTNAKYQLQKISDYNKTVGISGAYHNHSGNFAGSSIWELYDLLEGLDPKYLGCQYDIMHATIEGGKNWEYGLQLIHPLINSIVLKDFKWQKVEGKWKAVNVPLGEGMVDFKKYFSLLKQYRIQVPISLHVEYDLGGAEHGLKPTISNKEVLSRIKKDLDFIKSSWQEM